MTSNDQRICKNCKFIKQYIKPDGSFDSRPSFETYQQIKEKIENNEIEIFNLWLVDTVCRRFPPTIGYPTTPLEETCGEFKYRLNEPEQCEICIYFKSEFTFDNSGTIIFDGICRKNPNYIKKKVGDWCGSFDAIDAVNY